MMPKNFYAESVRHQLFRAVERINVHSPNENQLLWEQVLGTMTVTSNGNATAKAGWLKPVPGEITFKRTDFRLCQRGDLEKPGFTDSPGSHDEQKEEHGSSHNDPLVNNAAAADRIVAAMAQKLGINVDAPRTSCHDREEEFHDAWAAGESVDSVMVREAFEAPTAPEHRFILGILGDIRGKRVLDLGCGLGEAAVYFATLGAEVTACDLSSGMLDKVSQVATRFQVKVATHCAPAETTGLPPDQFDIVYAGNLLHHVDIERTLDEIRRVLKPNGIFVTWDPLAHNPLIKVYRRLAMGVRTPDEHPLHMRDLRLFEKRFARVEHHTFWLASLAVFLRFFFWERVHPSKERYWKKILTDAGRIGPFYKKLETIDRKLLALAPWLGRYCWNIVVWGQK